MIDRRGRALITAVGVVAALLAVFVTQDRATPAVIERHDVKVKSSDLDRSPPRLSATRSAPPMSSAQAQVDGPTIRLGSRTAWVRPGEEFVVRLLLEGIDPGIGAGVGPDGAPTTPSASLEVLIHSRLTSRQAFQQTLQERLLGTVIFRTKSSVTELTRDASGAVVVRLAIADGPQPDAVVLGQSGVYPVSVRLLDEAGEVAATMVTHIVRVPTDIADLRPLAFTWVVPLHAPPASPPADDGTAVAPDAEELGRLVDLIAALTDAPRVPLVLAPTPETLVALTAAPAGLSAIAALLNRLTSDDLLGLPFVRIDPSTLVGRGDGDEVGEQLVAGVEIASDVLGVRPPARTWLVHSTLTPAALGKLRDVGIDQLVVAEEALEPVARNLTLAAPFEVRDDQDRRLVAVVADEGLARHLPGPEPVLSAHHLLAELGMLYFDAPADRRGVVVVSPDDWRASRRFVETVLAGLSDSPIVRPTATFDDMAARVPLAVDRRGAPLERRFVSRPRVPHAPLLNSLRAEVTAFATMVGADNSVLDAVRRMLLSAASDDLAAFEQSQRRDRVHQLLTGAIDAIEVPNRRTITLTSRDGEIPVTLRNDNAFAVDVDVRLDSDKLGFPDGAEKRLRLEPGNTTTGFTVEARASGTFPLELTVSSPGGSLLVGQSRYTIRSTAVSGVGVLLSLGGFAFLVWWWSTHFRTTRANTRLAK